MGTLIFLGIVENEDPENEDRRRKTHSKTKTNSKTKTHSQNVQLRKFWREVECHELGEGRVSRKQKTVRRLKM